MTTQAEYRLPPHVRPKRYVLTLAPDLAAFTFTGDETVELDVDEPTDSIHLNAAELQVSAASVTLADGTVLQAQDIAHDEAAETVALRFERPVPAGGASLSVEFTGILNDQLRGFYRSQYTDADGAVRHLATTQFEPTDARRAFPCWDEPARKATFQVTLRVPRDLVAVSNMPVEGEQDAKDGLKDVCFAETPVMSTYLLAFIVGDLASVEATAKGGTLVRVWALRGKEEQGRFAVENAVRLLDYFNDYFGVPYPLPKLDHLALPDFAAGAMENWGAITYREVALLYDPENSGASTRQRILQIVSHEMAHMWFGDLVTMEWWDDLWLNESFASWMGDKAVDHLYPEWHVWTQFVSHDTNAGLSLDGLRNSHPIEAKVANPAEIQELFDAISYSKGAAVLRMLEQFLGPDTFQRGLQAYIARHQYGNARTRDLWDALEQASGQPVTAIMDTWTGQMGYPLLSVSSQPADGGVEVTLAQRRFLYDNLLGAAEDPALWRVPVSLLTSDASEAVDVLLTEREATVRLPDPASGDGGWLKANPGQTGFFRVDYAPRGVGAAAGRGRRESASCHRPPRPPGRRLRPRPRRYGPRQPLPRPRRVLPGRGGRHGLGRPRGQPPLPGPPPVRRAFPAAVPCVRRRHLRPASSRWWAGTPSRARATWTPSDASSSSAARATTASPACSTRHASASSAPWATPAPSTRTCGRSCTASRPRVATLPPTTPCGTYSAALSSTRRSCASWAPSAGSPTPTCFGRPCGAPSPRRCAPRTPSCS